MAEVHPYNTPKWSPDSRWLAFAISRNERSTIVVARPDGSETRLLAPSSGARRRDQLFALRSDGRGVKQITHDRPVAYDDPIGHVVWVGRGRYVGRRLFYSRAPCNSSP